MFFKSKGKGGERSGRKDSARTVGHKQDPVYIDELGQYFYLDEEGRKAYKLRAGEWVPLPPEERTLVPGRATATRMASSRAETSRVLRRPSASRQARSSSQSGAVRQQRSVGQPGVTGQQRGSAQPGITGQEGGADRQGVSSQTGAQERRRRRPIKRTKKSGKRWKGILALIIIVVIICTAVAMALKSKHGEAAPTAAQTQATATVPAPANGGPTTKVAKEPLSLAKSEQPMYILLVGVDDKNPAQADALFVVAINRDRKDIDIIGIPSNTKVDSRDKKKVDSLKSMYSTGGVMLTKAVVEDIFHITIPYYVVMNESAFSTTVDKVGNYDLYVEENMTHMTAAGTEDIHLSKGYQRLSGQSALGYVRYVDQQTSGFGRVQRQERFMKQYFALSNDQSVFTRVWRLWRLWGSYTSNISTADIMKLAWDTRSYTDDDYHFFILPGVWEQVGQEKYWNVDPTEAQRLVGITMGNESTDVVQALEPSPTADDKVVGKVGEIKVEGKATDGDVKAVSKDDKTKDGASSNAKSSGNTDTNSSKTRKDTHD